jgi:hypothetical protein|eukprot:6710896-Prymnesium_polylepis.1
MLAESLAERYPEAWITVFHVINALTFVQFAQATYVAWYPKAPKPLAIFFVTGVLIDGFLRHVVPLLPATVDLPSLDDDLAQSLQSCVDACSTIFLVTFVMGLLIDATPNLALGTFCVAILSVVTDLFNPADAARILACGFDMLCWSAPVEYKRRHHSAFREDVTLCLVKTASNALLAAVCATGRHALLMAYEADAALAIAQQAPAESITDANAAATTAADGPVEAADGSDHTSSKKDR